MPKYRINRINDSVAQEISLILRDVKDPRVSDGMLTVTGAAECEEQIGRQTPAQNISGS